MSMTFGDLQTEVKRRATKNQGGSQFTTAIQTLINTSLLHVANEENWRVLRRNTTLATVAPETTGTLTATKGSNSYTGSGTLLVTNNVAVGRRIQISGSTQRYVITSITSDTVFTTNLNYDGTTASSLTFTIFGQEEYALPPQVAKIGLVWHEGYGYPFLMEYISDLDFYSSGTIKEISYIPTYYRMWGEDNVLRQPNIASVLSVSSSASADKSIDIVIFGTVSGYPDWEKITTNSSDGTTVVNGTKSFTTVERIAKTASTTGRITVTSNSANVTVAVLPVGAVSDTIEYKKMQIWPLPNAVFNMNVQYYKKPFYMVNSGDTHELGQDFDEAIILLATAKIKAEENQDEADRFLLMYRDEIKNLKKMNMDILPNWHPKLRRPKDTRILTGGLIRRNLAFMQLGGSYGPTASGAGGGY